MVALFQPVVMTIVEDIMSLVSGVQHFVNMVTDCAEVQQNIVSLISHGQTLNQQLNVLRVSVYVGACARFKVIELFVCE